MPIQICVVYAASASEIDETELDLPAGATVADALQASGLAHRHPKLDWRSSPVGIWGRKSRLEQPLRDRDRVEVYRGLRVDPKVARRERFASQGARGTGLFAKRRAGAKPGY